MTTTDAAVPATTPVPTLGYTKGGRPVYRDRHNYHKDATTYQRFNKATAIWITTHVMTMTFFWISNLVALCSLPAILSEFSAFHGVFPSFIRSASLIALIAWISSNWLQLVFLPAIGVGQNIQGEAADARASKTLEDTERLLDAMDIKTEGGLHDAVAAIIANQAIILEAIEKKGGSTAPTGA